MKEVPVFIASSINEFAQERLELSEFFDRLNDVYRDSGVYLTWNSTETMSRAIIKGGSQERYDQKILQSRFFIIIVGQHLGAYTVREFQIAFEQFLTTGWPVILPYFYFKPDMFPSKEIMQFREYLSKDLDLKYKDLKYTAPSDNFEAIKQRIHIDLARSNAFTFTGGTADPEIEKNDEKRVCITDSGETDSFQVYEGEKPYIFVSYSRKDYKTISPILKAMCQAGYRIWYDVGIPWATEWPDEIAEHLKRCAVFIAFHSDSSKKSRHCKAEIHYATSKEKCILSVYLDDVQLSPGLEMYLSVYQSVKFSQYRNPEAFIKRLKKEKGFIACQETLGQQSRSEVNQHEYNNGESFTTEADRAMTCNNLGNLLFSTNRMNEAEVYYREALEIFRRLGKTNPDTYETYVAITCNSLGKLFSSTNRIEEAELYFRQALDIYRKYQDNNSIL